MKRIIALGWILFALLALVWTATAWIAAAGTQWLAQAVASGTAAEAARELSAVPLPQWLAFWLDPAWLQAIESGVQWLAGIASASLPFAGSAASWLVPAVWVAWGLGMLLLAAGAACAHLLVRHFAGRTARLPEERNATARGAGRFLPRA